MNAEIRGAGTVGLVAMVVTPVTVDVFPAKLDIVVGAIRDVLLRQAAGEIVLDVNVFPPAFLGNHGAGRKQRQDAIQNRRP